LVVNRSDSSEPLLFWGERAGEVTAKIKIKIKNKIKIKGNRSCAPGTDEGVRPYMGKVS
jgi:hypothetical protein